MFLKPDIDDVTVGGPDGNIEPDERGVFHVPAATGAALLRMGGWVEVGPHVEPEPAPEPVEPVKPAPKRK